MNGEWEEAKAYYFELYQSVATYLYVHSAEFVITVVVVSVGLTLALIVNDWRRHRMQKLLDTYVPQRRGKMLKRA